MTAVLCAFVLVFVMQSSNLKVDIKAYAPLLKKCASGGRATANQIQCELLPLSSFCVEPFLVCELKCMMLYKKLALVFEFCEI